MTARKNRRHLVAASAAMALLTLAACGSDDSSGGGGSTDGPLTWVIIAPLSGAAAGYGESTVSGFEASAKMINEAGGIDGRDVKVVGIDDAYDPSQAVTKLQDYIAKNGNPDMVFPGISSTETLAILPVTTGAEIFTVDYSASSDLADVSKYPYAFHTFMPADQLAGFETDEVKTRGFDSVGFVTLNNASGQTSSGAMEAAAEAADMEFTKVLVDPASTDSSSSLQQVQDADPDIVIFDGLGPAPLSFLAAREKLGWDVPVLGTPTYAQNDLMSLGEAALEGVDLLVWANSTSASPLVQSPAYTDFRASLTEAGVDSLTIPNTAAVFAYNAAMVAWAAYQGAGDATDGPSLAKALEDGKAPKETMELSLGPTDWGYSDSDHFQTFTSTDVSVVSPGNYEDGLLVPQS